MRVAARLTLANLVALLLAAAVPATGAGRERVAPVLLPGTSPHTFEPTPASVRALTGAEMLFAIGHGLDDWTARPARGAGVLQVVPVDAGIALRRANDGARGRVDPHCWLSASNAKVIARIEAAELARRAPGWRTEVERSTRSRMP